MDPRMLEYYNRELQHLRETGGEFAKEHPKIAARLGLDGFECADPYVERLLEGFAYLAARVQIKIDSEFPRFTKHLLEMVFPNYLSPTPSMAVVEFQPDLTEGSLGDGYEIPRDTSLKSPLGKGEQTALEYRTGHPVTLWPLEVVGADYLSSSIELATLPGPAQQGVRAALLIRLKTTAGLTFDQTALDRLTFFLRGSNDLSMRIYEQLLANHVRIVARPAGRDPAWQEVIEGDHVRRVGFGDSEALLPYSPRSFQGYRLLHEFFAFPDRFMFVSISGFRRAVKRCQEDELELLVCLDSAMPELENTLEPDHFALFCAPAVNIFPMRADRIHLKENVHEYHVLPDRTRPMDFEVYSIDEVTGYGHGREVEIEFLPFYFCNDLSRHTDHRAFYSVHRVPRLMSSSQRRYGPRSTYIGSEVFLSLVDANEAPFSSDLRQLALRTYCTNRDLPLHMPTGIGKTDFELATGAPVEAIRVVAGPTKPRPSFAEGRTAWRLISHLALNYLSLLDTDTSQGASALRELFMLYGGAMDLATQKQIEGVTSVSSEPVNRWLSEGGQTAFVRGLEISLTFDESAFGGSGIFLFGAVLERFFAKYVSINSFTETIIRSLDRGEVVRWPARPGLRQLT
jgi:type VI secretion system protein ImpG